MSTKIIGQIIKIDITFIRISQNRTYPVIPRNNHEALVCSDIKHKIISCTIYGSRASQSIFFPALEQPHK